LLIHKKSNKVPFLRFLPKMSCMNKPIKPALHGIMDYLFSGVQLLVPSLLKLNKKAVKTYAAMGTGFLATNALTDTPVGIKPVISLQTHRQIDAVALASLAMLSVAKPIRKDKKALTFHLFYLAAAITNYVLTDYNTEERIL
jgi:hypothetical protein